MQLLPGETVLAAGRFDLDASLHFSDGGIVLTTRRVIADRPASTTQPLEGAGPWTWTIGPQTRLDVQLRSAVGRVELSEGDRVVARWLFTPAKADAIHALEDAFDARVAGPDGLSQPEGVRKPAAVADDGGPESDEKPAPAGRGLGDDGGGPASWRALFRLITFARPHAGMAILGGLLSLASTTAALVPPYLTMPLVDKVLIPRQNGQDVPFAIVWWYLGGLLAAALAAWLLSWAQTWVLAWVSERIAAGLRTRTYAHMQTLSLDFFQGKRTGDLMSRVGSDTDKINVFLSVNLIEFASNVMLLALTAAVLVWLNPLLALLTLVPFPFVVWLIYAVRERLRRGFARAAVAWSDMTSVLADTIPGIRVVKAFAQEGRETQRFRAANQSNLQVNDRLNKTWSLFTPTVSLLTEIGLLVVWAFGIWQVSKNEITVGVLTAFIAYIGRFYGRLDSMSRIVSVTQKAAAGAKRIFDILDHVSNVPDPVNPVPLVKPQGRIELAGIGFRYGNRSVIRSLDLDIRPGEMIGLVGHSGSGKSTLVNLICRFYDVTDGRILVDGVDIRRYALADYRRHIGLVLQEPFLFFGTIAENIAYGRPDASREEIVAAARAAHAHEFILRLPLGYDSLVGERGQGLSGGERQRISIARALLIDPRILILDEATSSVDTETEKEIQKALDNLVQGRTTIAIAHRLSTLRKADRLVVMDRGRIVEVGPHDELIERRGAYWRLYEAQVQTADDSDQDRRALIESALLATPSSHASLL